MNLNQITIPSQNVEKALAFYQQLGLLPIVLALPNYVRLVCPDGQSTFSIHLVRELSNGEGVWVYFECEGLDKKVMDLQQQGVVFEHEPIDQPWLWREARLKDLDNNTIILYFAGDNRLSPPWRVS